MGETPPARVHQWLSHHGHVTRAGNRSCQRLCQDFPWSRVVGTEITIFESLAGRFGQEFFQRSSLTFRQARRSEERGLHCSKIAIRWVSSISRS